MLGGATIASETARPSAAIGTRMTWRTANETGSIATISDSGGGATESSIGVEMNGYRKNAQVWSGDSPAAKMI